jgi:hypothetical protein
MSPGILDSLHGKSITGRVILFYNSRSFAKPYGPSLKRGRWKDEERQSKMRMGNQGRGLESNGEQEIEKKGVQMRQLVKAREGKLRYNRA